MFTKRFPPVPGCFAAAGQELRELSANFHWMTWDFRAFLMFLCCATVRNCLNSKPFGSYALPYFDILHVFWHVTNNRNIEVMVDWHFIYLKLFFSGCIKCRSILASQKEGVWVCNVGNYWHFVKARFRSDETSLLQTLAIHNELGAVLCMFILNYKHW